MVGTAVLEREVREQDVRTKNEGQTVVKEERRQAEEASRCYDFPRYAQPAAWEKNAAQEADVRTEAKEQVKEPATSPADRVKSYTSIPRNPSFKRVLFADYAYSNGTLLHRDPETDVMVPVYEGSEYKAPVEEMPYETATAADAVHEMKEVEAQTEVLEEGDEEDALPTRRTLETVARPAAYVREITNPDIKTGILSAIAALSTKMKVAIVSIAVTIVLAIVMICINTNIIRSLDSDLADLKTRATEQQQTYERLQQESDLYTDPDSEIVRDYAESNGMTK